MDSKVAEIIKRTISKKVNKVYSVGVVGVIFILNLLTHLRSNQIQSKRESTSSKLQTSGVTLIYKHEIK